MVESDAIKGVRLWWDGSVIEDEIFDFVDINYDW